MNSSLRTNVGLIVSGILTVALAGLFGWVSYVAPPSAPGVATHNALAAQEFQAMGAARAFPAIELVPRSGLPAAQSGNYQLVSSWYKNKHWWKRNAPVVGGAVGGAAIGGLAGGGAGAVIGGAVGGGGGLLYKHLKHRNSHKDYSHNYDHNNHHDSNHSRGEASRVDKEGSH